MKVWKRAAALVCALGFVGAGVACKSDAEKKIEDMTPQTQVEDIAAALEGVKSLKLSIDSSASVNGVADGEQGDVKMDAGIDLWLSKTDDFLDAKVVVEYSMDYAADGESNKEEQKVEAYLVGGYAYVVMDYQGEKMGVKTEDSIFALLADEMGVEEKDVKSIFATAFEKAGEVGIPTDLLNEFMALSPVAPSEEKTETSMSLVYDYKAMINNLIGNVTGITDKTTIGDFIDSMLVDLGEKEMTCTKLLDKVAPYGQKTVKDVKAEIEKEFDFKTEDIIKAVQENKDLLAMLDEMEPGMSDMVKNFKLDDIMNEYGNMKIDELIAMLSGEEITVAQAVAQAKEMLKTPVKEVMPIDKEVIDVLKGITINTAKTEFKTEYDEDANLTAISAGVNADVKLNFTVDGTSADLKCKSSVSYTLSEFSKSATEIKLPDIQWQTM